MGRKHRQKPECLASKLHTIRIGLNLTQEQMIKRLECPAIPLHPASISEYERGRREPPLLVLLAYARQAGVTMEMLVDDDTELPEPLPSRTGHAWIMKRVRVGEQKQ